tara:strand:+ start:1785 stop:2189 length:405 start_codon:yes stop_codon:yes gene_type:complete
MSVAKQADNGLFGKQRKKDGIYRRIRKDEPRQITIRWKIDYSNDNCVYISTHIDSKDVNLSWEEWDNIKYDSSRTEEVKSHIEELFKHNLSWSLDKIEDIGTAYDGDLEYTVRDKVDNEWYKPVPEWDKHLGDK